MSKDEGKQNMMENDQNESGDSANPPVKALACRKCGKHVGVAENFCSHCGLRQEIIVDAWYYRPVWILVLALTVLGPFALYLVWKSPKMSPAVKAIVTTVTLVYTALCLYYTYVLRGAFERG